MAKFAIVDVDGTMEDERYDTLDSAIAEATKDVSDNADTEVEIVQIIKRVSSTLVVDVKDV